MGSVSPLEAKRTKGLIAKFILHFTILGKFNNYLNLACGKDKPPSQGNGTMKTLNKGEFLTYSLS